MTKVASCLRSSVEKGFRDLTSLKGEESKNEWVEVQNTGDKIYSRSEPRPSPAISYLKLNQTALSSCKPTSTTNGIHIYCRASLLVSSSYFKLLLPIVPK
jgi:hypothetical protein